MMIERVLWGSLRGVLGGSRGVLGGSGGLLGGWRWVEGGWMGVGRGVVIHSLSNPTLGVHIYVSDIVIIN